MSANDTQNGYAIVLASSELARVQAVSIIGSIAAMSEIPVDVFVTMDGLLPFEKETVENGDFDVGPVGARMLEAEDMDVPLFTEQMENAKEIGPMRIYACTMAMDLMGNTLDDYVDLFDEELGVSGFLQKAADKQIVFV
ncbi:DsrE/DsrF/DrsH-like family protein [Haloarculaceae archaeon H-GB2-1]|nr:DsrE/DsrF/DrsH-like family protein [Haloarculaceae archaeon H-GB1-1]MEA5389030.1 DsrE/DsrF/DrsH-like family protein [Haloarculaceae archaeon H-GB11]MEA5407090.1 DsrE/DsrF/DrsH-like family protein [Haloarculaceae archaeon H-GB2-1]